MQDSFFMLSFVICFVRILGIKVLVTKKKKKRDGIGKIDTTAILT